MPEVIVVGGGLMGCATASYLLREDPTLDILIIEPDPSYAQAATPRASGGIRQLFTCPENAALSSYSLDVLDRWSEFAGAGSAAEELSWTPNGYLFIADHEQTDGLRQTWATAQQCGVVTEWLEPDDLRQRFPALHTSDLGPAVLSPRDGWLDPHSFLMGFRALATRLGARFRKDQVSGFSVIGSTVRTAALRDGETLGADVFINTAGCWAPQLAAPIGMDLPIEPMRRFEHFVEGPTEMRGYPFIKDPTGLAIRPEGTGLSVGLVDFTHPGGFDTTVDRGYFEQHVWPALAHRIPSFDRARLRTTTAGLYDQNRFDGNMVIGNWPGNLDNLYIACGFSGHGMMHAPGVGRALSELVLHGRYQTIDLSNLDYQRILDHQAYPETGIK